MAITARFFVCLLLSLAASAPLWSQDTTWPRTVVLTNDDGIEAEGLLALAEAFAPIAKTYVIAPLGNRSGSTNYVSAIARRGLEVESRELGSGIVAYAVDGYPADAVVFALRGLLADDPPDLVISGINTGPNLSDDWNLSGTVGAAQMASFLGVRAIAVSGYDANQPTTAEAIAGWIVELARSPLVREMQRLQYLTVSIPQVAPEEIRGAEIVRRGQRPWRLQMERSAEAASAPGRELWSLRFAPSPTEALPGTDTYVFAAKRIAIVPMRVDEVDYGQLDTLLRQQAAPPAWSPATGRSPR